MLFLRILQVVYFMLLGRSTEHIDFKHVRIYLRPLSNILIYS